MYFIHVQIEVQQENQEYVCCVGSATCVENPPLFAQGNCAIAVDPSPADYNYNTETNLDHTVYTCICI